MKKLKPIYIYLIAVVLFAVGNLFNEYPVVYYTITAIGGFCFLWAIIKYFRK